MGKAAEYILYVLIAGVDEGSHEEGLVDGAILQPSSYSTTNHSGPASYTPFADSSCETGSACGT